jgi:hypothetical protein
MQSALDVQSTFLDMSLSDTAGYLPHIVLELRRAETTTSVSHLEAHIQAAPAEQFPEKRIVEQSTCQIAHDNVSDDSSPNPDAEQTLYPRSRIA